MYEKWHEAVRKYSNGEVPKYGAIWMLYYPNVMLEWYDRQLRGEGDAWTARWEQAHRTAGAARADTSSSR